MGKIIFIEHDSTEHVTEFGVGSTLMQIAVDKTGAVGDTEEQMLSMTPERAKTSRLGCQIETTEAMDGMTVHLPEFQM